MSGFPIHNWYSEIRFLPGTYRPGQDRLSISFALTPEELSVIRTKIPAMGINTLENTRIAEAREYRARLIQSYADRIAHALLLKLIEQDG